VLCSTWARPDAYLRAMADSWRWLPEAAPSERAMLEALFLWIYTPRAHANGVVEETIEETLAFPQPQSTEAFQAQLDAFMTHDTLDRLGEISVPTLVLAGELDIASPPRFGRVVADGIPNADSRCWLERHTNPSRRARFNARVDSFGAKSSQ
jgi:pimeloyl-ACP methyl ester carboxylesterase